MKLFFSRAAKSFFISCICGLTVNLLIDTVVTLISGEAFISIPVDFKESLATPVQAAYINVLLYGIIGASFGGFTVIYEHNRIGFIVQNILYFIATSTVWFSISIFIWQLQKYMTALICTLVGYIITYVIISTVQYKELKRNVNEINALISSSAADCHNNV